MGAQSKAGKLWVSRVHPNNSSVPPRSDGDGVNPHKLERVCSDYQDVPLMCEGLPMQADAGPGGIPAICFSMEGTGLFKILHTFFCKSLHNALVLFLISGKRCLLQLYGKVNDLLSTNQNHIGNCPY